MAVRLPWKWNKSMMCMIWICSNIWGLKLVVCLDQIKRLEAKPHPWEARLQQIKYKRRLTIWPKIKTQGQSPQALSDKTQLLCRKDISPLILWNGIRIISIRRYLEKLEVHLRQDHCLIIHIPQEEQRKLSLWRGHLIEFLGCTIEQQWKVSLKQLFKKIKTKARFSVKS